MILCLTDDLQDKTHLQQMLWIPPPLASAERTACKALEFLLLISALGPCGVYILLKDKYVSKTCWPIYL